MKWIMACLMLPAVMQGAVAIAKSRATNFTYVQSGPDGVFYARCIPAEKEGHAGRTEVYRVLEGRDELVDHYDLYPRGVVLGWSPIAGKVAWVNPAHATGNRPQGVAMQLPDNDAGRELKKKIEGILAPVAKSDRTTHTL